VILRKFPLQTILFAAILATSATPSLALSKKQAEQTGANLFRDKGCPYCHGPSTEGTKKGPSLLNLRKIMKAPAITSQILNGGKKMPSFADSLTNDEVANLVAWLRAKHRPQPTPLPTPPTTQSAQPSPPTQ
jgi:mono/diheme cytochrome c family protein